MMFQAIDRHWYRQFRRACLEPETRLVSVDIFDTLLLRTTRPEFARFLTIGRRQLQALQALGQPVSVSGEDALLTRLLAAQAAYRNAPESDGIREATYERIVTPMLRAWGLAGDAAQVQCMLDTELDYEVTQLRPNRLLVRILREAAEAGKRVIAISDMYFHADQLAVLTERTHVAGVLETIYSSADFGHGKSSKKLFESVMAIEQVQPDQMVHCGDNLISDYRRARDLGIKAFPVQRKWYWRSIEKRKRLAFRARYGLNTI